MHYTPSRREKREAKFCTLAEKGQMSCEDIFLYKSEERTLVRKEGFEVVRIGSDETKQLPSKVSWEKAFKNGIPLIVLNYINGIIQTFPYNSISTWAQHLYVIAARAKHDAAQKNNE